MVTKIVSPRKIRQFQINREKREARGSSGPKIYGIIKKVDDVTKSIVVVKEGGMFKEGKEEAFLIENTTKITRDRKEILFTELKEGMHVSVSYRLQITPSRMIATAINVYTPRGGSPIILPIKLKRVGLKS